MEGSGGPVGYKRKLIEVALPLDAISNASAREKSIRHGHPSTLHLWWARRPLAAARAVLWASLVDDPSSHPKEFPTEESQAEERERLFAILKQLVVWKNSNKPQVLADAREEIEKSCGGELPNVLDPFCGGGAIPLEARRLGLPSYGGDLNPVAVLISKALVEIPPSFAGVRPVNPDAQAALHVGPWDRAQGLAEDVGYYGRLMRERALERIGHLYPKARLPASKGGGEAAVIAWLWARTVESPDPSYGGHVPLVRSWVVRKAKKNKPAVYVEPMVDRGSRTITYRLREGDDAPKGTVSRGVGRCVVTGTVIPGDYIKAESRAGFMGEHLLCIVAEGSRGRIYLTPTEALALVADCEKPEWFPSAPVALDPRNIWVTTYGLDDWYKFFTHRQLVALSTFSDLLGEVRSVVEADARAASLVDDGIRLRDGGAGVPAYADAVLTYLAFVIDKCADYWSSICSWHNGRELIRNTFGRQAIPMVWDYAEANPFSTSSGNWMGQVAWVQKAVAAAPGQGVGEVLQRDAVARIREVQSPVVCTDPPYYDNISYADLSDFFYVWLRRNVADVWPDETATLLTPKVEELIANPYRAGSKQSAKEHFERGMLDVLRQVATSQHSGFPTTVFYAYKQQETIEGDRAVTGWETFLQGLIDAELEITATWPIRTELSNRPVARDTAALASSIVIACRPRRSDASLATRREFLDALQTELPRRVRIMQRQAIVPVDMAQSAIGPGMEVFSRYVKVVEADGSQMGVRTAIGLINEALEEVLSSEDTELDADTRWALTWYEQNGYDAASFGDAETLSKAKNTSVQGVERAGIIQNVGGKVRILTRDELEQDWDPLSDQRRTDWKLTQHLIVLLEQSEEKAGDLLRAVGGGMGDRALRLAWLLHGIAEREGRSSDVVAYNSLIRSWHDIERQARLGPPAEQSFDGM